MSDKNVTILYVDDEETNLFLFNIHFEGKYNVITAVSGQEGLDKLSSNHNDIIVVISDMNMPKMNGIEFIKRAKEIYANIAYFILTGFDYNEEIEDALTKNVIQKFFTKPFDVQQIEAAVDEAAKKLS